MQPGVRTPQDLNHPREIQRSSAKRNLGQQEPVLIWADCHVFDVSGPDIWSQRLGHLHRIIQQCYVVAEIKTTTEKLALVSLEQSLHFLEGPVLVVFDGER